VIDHLLSLVCSSWQRQDLRVYQIAVLAGLFGYGVVWLDFAVSGMQTVVILATILLTQALCGWLWKLPTYNPRRALISGLSLCLLLAYQYALPRHAAGIPRVGYPHVACTT
jgi:hypothetical protein